MCNYFRFFAKVIIPKPVTCAALKNQYKVSNNGYYSLYDHTNKPHLAFCDFQSDPGFAWTLIESLSLTHARTSTFRKSFYYNVPSNECTPNWSNYRISKARMIAIKNAASSTHFRATCNFNSDSEKGLSDRRNYLRVSFCAYGLFLQSRNRWNCAVVDYINIRGTSCSKCSIPLYSNGINHLHTNVPYARKICGRFNVPNPTSNEQSFGHYSGAINRQFSCTESSSSTTNWWIGGAFFD